MEAKSLSWLDVLSGSRGDSRVGGQNVAVSQFHSAHLKPMLSCCRGACKRAAQDEASVRVRGRATVESSVIGHTRSRSRE